jgi:peptidoglycan/LPS O-acetylase OafA/YrhL
MSVATWAVPTSTTSPDKSSTLRHIPELDGVRGIAIALVLVCHCGYLFPAPFREWLSLGWVGVDLFFVLSGFLITRILLASCGQEGYFRNFYFRRALRIFPLYFLFVGAYFFFLLPMAHRYGFILDRNASDQWWFWSYLANWHYGSTHSTLTHLWSLGIEEQFYLVWPAVVALVPTKRLGQTCLGLAAFSLGARAILIGYAGLGREASFFTACRIEGIALGAWLAIGFRFRRPGTVALMAATGLVLLLRSGGPNGFAMTVAGITLVAILFAMFLQAVISPGREGSLASWVLRRDILTRLGKYSYAIYLLHMPLLTVAVRVHERRNWSPALLFLGGILGSYLLGWLSWRVFESKILQLKGCFVQPLRRAD